MRLRTVILLILVIVFAAVALYLLVLRPEGGLFGGGEDTAAQPAVEQESGTTQDEPGAPPPTPTPQIQFEDVIVSIVDLPVGERIRPDLVQVVQRPVDNVAVVAGVTFSDPEEVVGELVRTFIGRGQEILLSLIHI